MNQKHKAMAQSRGAARDLTVCALLASLIAVGAFIKIVIPVGADTMNFTLQWFFVLLAGLLLGSRKAFWSVAIYLLVGLSGIPVFARGGGLGYLIRPTFGFLIGFVAAAWITGKLCWKRPGGGVAWRLFSAFWGMMAYYLCGMVYFYVISNYVIHMPVSWKLVVINCFLITAAEDFILCVMAAVVARRLMPFALGQYR